MMPKRVLALAASGLALALLASACTSSSTHAGASPAASPTDRASAIRAFAACMSQHGVSVPEASPGQQSARGFLRSLDRTDPKVASALQACRGSLGFGGRGFGGRGFGGPRFGTSPSPSAQPTV